MNYLIFINSLGVNYKGENTYEFIFSKTLEVWGESWDSKPANSYPLPPDLEYINKVGILKTSEIALELIQHSDVFSVMDATDDVIALGWEVETENVDFSETKRLVFKFGQTEEEVKNKLYERDIVLQFEKKVVYEN